VRLIPSDKSQLALSFQDGAEAPRLAGLRFFSFEMMRNLYRMRAVVSFCFVIVKAWFSSVHPLVGATRAAVTSLGAFAFDGVVARPR
jgi:hypothetical protein